MRFLIIRDGSLLKKWEGFSFWMAATISLVRQPKSTRAESLAFALKLTAPSLANCLTSTSE
ncbi:MAG: hypothetical protein M0P04_06395 [Syntrophales bacterium]|nr:hypothetical protein [Syntrophales bacterium]MDD4339747.1 hypothetical protein [Syntrophales bacterium]HOG07986.1 hypothetical protein [Syntrophales bacterium]HQP28744.1 hypothetical protein [Syntrophales bacterium]